MKWLLAALVLLVVVVQANAEPTDDGTIVRFLSRPSPERSLVAELLERAGDTGGEDELHYALVDLNSDLISEMLAYRRNCSACRLHLFMLVGGSYVDAFAGAAEAASAQEMPRIVENEWHNSYREIDLAGNRLLFHDGRYAKSPDIAPTKLDDNAFQQQCVEDPSLFGDVVDEVADETEAARKLCSCFVARIEQRGRSQSDLTLWYYRFGGPIIDSQDTHSPASERVFEIIDEINVDCLVETGLLSEYPKHGYTGVGIVAASEALDLSEAPFVDGCASQPNVLNASHVGTPDRQRGTCLCQAHRLVDFGATPGKTRILASYYRDEMSENEVEEAVPGLMKELDAAEAPCSRAIGFVWYDEPAQPAPTGGSRTPSGSFPALPRSP